MKSCLLQRHKVIPWQNTYASAAESFTKSVNADTTGYRIPDYGEKHECFGCPFILPVKDFNWNEHDQKFDYTIRAWECRASQSLRYNSYARMALGSKNTGSIYSLDFAFLEKIQKAILDIDGISSDSDSPGNRAAQYGSDGLYRIPINAEQNKKGIAAKQMLFDMFFAADGSRKDVAPEEERQIVLKQIEEATMGKLNISNINNGLNQVKSITEALANVARFEMVPTDLIDLADYNPYAESDNDDSRYRLAMSIQACGLIEPLAVNKHPSGRYKLIAGESRLTSINQYLHWKSVGCMVFEGISDDEARLKLHEANRYREYSAAQKFKAYQDLEQLLTRMKESGKYQGPIQKGIAETLGVTTHQVRKYERIVENLSEEQKQKVYSGELSIDKAYRLAQPPHATDTEYNADLVDDESGRASAFAETSSALTGETHDLGIFNNPPMQPKTEEQEIDTEPDHTECQTLKTDFDQDFWYDKIKCALKRHYDENEIYLYYLFQVPTTQEAIRDKLKPRYGGGGGTVIFPDGEHGYCTYQIAKLELSYKAKHAEITYAQADGYIREMIRCGEWLTKADARAAVKNKLNL